jgi:subtilase family serine protease
MAKNNQKEKKENEVEEDPGGDNKEPDIKKEPNVDQKETEGNSENETAEKSNTTKIAIIILIFVILILTVFLALALRKKTPDKSPINIVPEQAVSPQSSATSQTTNETVNSTNTAPGNTDSLISATEPPVVTSEVKKADLYISEYYFSEDPKMGEEFTIKIKIGNKGKANADDFHWEWWPTAYDKACEGEVDGLAVGEIKKVECTYTYGGWSTYATKAVVDTKYEVDESNESNNVASKQVVPIHDQKPDLYITDYSFNHWPTMGEEFTISIKIKNKGNGDADSFHWEWWPTAYGKYCKEEIDGLDAGDSKTVTCTYTYGGWANYATKAVADSDDDISESDEGNNTYSQTVMPNH